MNLQNLKNYLIFLLAVGHMLTAGDASRVKMPEEITHPNTSVTMADKPMPDSALTKKPSDNDQSQSLLLKLK